jgi:isopenicillin-N N-acyltransferase like protein
MHGRTAKKQILSSIENYRTLFESLTPPLKWSTAIKIATKFLPTIEQHIPSAIEEIQGIASSSGVPFEDILVLNCRSEIGLTGGSVDGCSAISYKNPITGKQLLCQNWDWHNNQLENVIILDITHLNGTRVVTITEAGIIGKVGFNGDCVGVTLNAIRTEGIPLNYSMLPIHFALRYVVLESPSAGEAINRLMRIGVASTAHFLIADSISAYGVEVSPLGNGVILPDEQGFIVHTNHWISSVEKVKSVVWLPDTYSRLKRLETLKSKVHDEEDVWEILADEEESPGSICRGVTVGKGTEDDLETLFGVVMDLESGVAEMVHGRPTRGRPRVLLPRTGPLGNIGNDVRRQSAL